MIVGLDFDNCIVNYENAIKKLITDKNIFNSNESANFNKENFKEIIINRTNEDNWTLIQGSLYGKYIKYAKPYPNAVKIINNLLKKHSVYIISHKTLNPFFGRRYNLHKSAQKWIKNNLIDQNKKPLLNNNLISFNEKVEDKIKTISKLGCDIFLDDLPQILTHKEFPKKIDKFLFNPNNKKYDESIYLNSVNSWNEFYERIKK